MPEIGETDIDADFMITGVHSKRLRRGRLASSMASGGSWVDPPHRVF